METPVGTEILVDQWCVNCPLRIEGRDMPGNLHSLDMHDFDVILGMDWLSKKGRKSIGSSSGAS
jgi:Retroviral aspartyl protease